MKCLCMMKMRYPTAKAGIESQILWYCLRRQYLGNVLHLVAEGKRFADMSCCAWLDNYSVLEDNLLQGLIGDDGKEG